MQPEKTPLAVFWFRRDLRLDDNAGLYHALNSGLPVLPVFIFDQNIISELPGDDPRITFIHKTLNEINTKLHEKGSSLLVLKGNPDEVLTGLSKEYNIRKIFYNRDYEPYALARDKKIELTLSGKGIEVHSFKDQVLFEPCEIIKEDGKPYTVFTPFKNKWAKHFHDKGLQLFKNPEAGSFYEAAHLLPSLTELGFVISEIEVRDFDLSVVENYARLRDIPSENATSFLGPHLRFGTISPRQVISLLEPGHETFISELIWREFFMQILFFFPKVVNQNFRSKYDGIIWRNREDEFKKWCEGKTGYPIVDAGMRQLNQTGFMHNRVRMVTASFLCKHLLIDWRWGEAYFAEKLLDYELSSNNGNWQWAAGTGCDAAPYFRVFNPYEQQKKFDSEYRYVKQWVEELDTSEYPRPMVEHSFARQRALDTYKKGINQ